MPVPFELPDKCDLYRNGEVVPYAENVPCRQVPNMRYGRPGTGGLQGLAWTHWVDFEPDVAVEDNSMVPVGFFYPTVGFGDTIQMVDFPVLLTLRVIWVEDRYTNTPGEYVRAYAVRVLREA